MSLSQFLCSYMIMIEYLKDELGLFFSLISFFTLIMSIFIISRFFLLIWKKKRVDEASGWLKIIISGVRMDIVTCCYIIIFPIFLISISSNIYTVTIIKYYFIFILWLVVYMELTTPSFINEYDVRPNRYFIEYLKYPKEVFSMLFKGYKLELSLSLMISILTLILGWKFINFIFLSFNPMNLYFSIPVGLVLISLCVLGARSTLGHRGINPSMVSFSHDCLMNDLILNSTYSIAYAMKLLKKSDNKNVSYPKIPLDEVIKELQKTSYLDIEKFKHQSLPTLAYHKASNTSKRKNIVILLQESLGAQFVGGLGGLPLTPNLDKLMNESWNFTQMYATGTRSIRGIEAVTTGFFPTSSDAVVKRVKSQNNFYSLAQTLKNEGYHTQFIYGGESHFDNMKGFLLGNGVVDIQELKDFINPEFVGSWGACDEDLYSHAHNQFTQLHQQEKNFFSLVFTTTNHSPYEFPDSKIELYQEPKACRENTVKYSDYALGEFIKKAKESVYWDDTIFVIVADHDSRVYGNKAVPIERFRIPTVFFGANIKMRKDTRVSSQIDIPPTLLSLAGISCYHPMLGNDLSNEDINGRAIMQYNQNFAYMNSDYHTVIFRPECNPESYIYDHYEEKLESTSENRTITKIANSHALWGNICYKNDYYKWSEIKNIIKNNENDEYKLLI